MAQLHGDSAAVPFAPQMCVPSKHYDANSLHIWRLPLLSAVLMMPHVFQSFIFPDLLEENEAAARRAFLTACPDEM